jgi:hypothetical protein
MSEQSQKALRDSDLVSAVVSGAVAALCMSYAANAARPGLLQLVVALVAICATVSAYLFIARSKVEPEYKAGTVIIVGAVGALYLILLSRLL